jgi:Fe-S cluster assembly protein SufD
MSAESEKERYLSDYRRFREGASADPGWLGAVRDAAIERFAEIGFPSPREEDWRYTNVARVVSAPLRPAFEFDLAGEADLADASIARDGGPRLVFVNGRRVRGATDGDAGVPGVEITSIAELLADGDERLDEGFARLAKFDRNGFTALSTAFLHDGAFIAIAENAIVDLPIEVVFATSAAKGDVVAHPRIFVRAGRNSRATIIERYVSIAEGATLTNAVAEVVVADAAELSHLRIASEGARASHVATTEVAQARDSRYRSFALALDAAFLRHNLGVRCDAAGAECSLDGLYVAGGHAFVDNHTEIDHAAPHTSSRELYKGILGGRAKAVFNGKVIVRPDAQKTDAQQTNRNLLLSGHAEIDTKPELQISADDVKCSHGAAIGQLDPQALFYLKSRGIGEAAGRRLLVHAFANEMIERFGNASLAPALERVVTASINALLGGER